MSAKKYSAKMLQLLQYSREQQCQNLHLPVLECGYPSKLTKQLILDLKKTAFIYSAPFLTFNQVGQDTSVLVLADHGIRKSTSQYFDPINTKFNTYLNVKIIKISNDMEEAYEECSSQIGIESLVSRYTDIQISYMTEDGNTKEEEFTGFRSKQIQQAVDLLSGRLPLKWNISWGNNRITPRYNNLSNVRIIEQVLFVIIVPHPLFDTMQPEGQ